jgi:zinc protease
MNAARSPAPFAASGPSPAQSRRIGKLNASVPALGRIEHIETVPFGPSLRVERFVLQNGLQILVCAHHVAPVVAYHTWYRVGSRHEREGKTGLAHLFEHLMFGETEQRAAGEFDRKLEEAGAESNAATWLDWTQYTVSVPREQLALVIELEAERMAHLVLRAPQVQSEKEVVANERRYRVEDDVEGSVSEQLWATAFERHSYRWPTIGWMNDILAFTAEDCRDFYKTYYAPNNATLVVVGDVNETALLKRIARAYGHIEPSVLPVEEVWPEPPQLAERRQELSKPTPTEKLAIGYRGPAMGDADHPAVTVLGEILFGGRASRLQQCLVQELELATEARVFVGPFRDPGLVEIFASARGQHTADELLAVTDEQLGRLRSDPVTEQELQRARARLELGLVAGLANIEGKASTLGFYETVLGRPAGGFERLEAMRRVDASDVRRAARRYLVDTQRTVLLVRSNTATSGSSEASGTP